MHASLNNWHLSHHLWSYVMAHKTSLPLQHCSFHSSALPYLLVARHD
jgi:hypothetical protein